MKLINQDLIEGMHAQALASPRLRTHFNLHASHSETIQRMCMVMEPGSYVRPHRHPDKWELLIAISGELAVLAFNNSGHVLARTHLSPQGPILCLEQPASVWHAVVALMPACAVLEVKPGPYQPTPESDFADWAPAEGDPQARVLECWYRIARPGARVPV